MSVRKREWITPKGESKTAWLVDYRDSQGGRRAKQFARKKDADAFASTASVEVRQGTHTADSQSITVKKAGENWLARGRREGLEQSTLDAYDQHVRLHINPFLGTKRLNQLTRPMIEEFRDSLLDSGRSRAMAKRVLGSLTSIVKEAERLGHVAKNVCKDVTVKRSGREKAKVVPPSKEHLRQLIAAAAGLRPMDEPMLLIFLFAGLRASELRALPWTNVDLKGSAITVDQRADFQNVIGPPKSASGYRTIPVPPVVVKALRKWKLRCPPSKLGFVFPSQSGTPIFHANLVLGFQEPLQLAAGTTRERVVDGKPVLDDDGQPVIEGIYGLHDFRHAAASLWIEQRVAPKRVQTWMGHHSIQVTFDTYGHLFAALEDDAAVMGALEASVLGESEAVA
jgi:integrase